MRDKFVSDVAKECLDRLLQRYVQELLNRSGYTAETANGVLRDKDLVENQLGPLVQGKVSLEKNLLHACVCVCFLTKKKKKRASLLDGLI